MFLEKAFRGENNRWYIYLLTVLLVFTFMSLGSLPAALYSGWRTGNVAIEIRPDSAVGLALVLGSFIVALATLFMGVKYLHGKRFVDTCSGRDRFDIKRCLFAMAAWGGVSVLAMAIQYAVGFHASLRFQFELLPFLSTGVVVLLFLPFQVAWEECMFRGYLMQGFAALFKYRWIPLVLTSLIFGLMHGSNPEIEQFGFWTAMPQYVLMGVILGYVAIKDDGIELALGLHFANNLLAALLVTHESSALQTRALFVDTHPTSSHWDTLVILTCGIFFIWLCNKKYHFISNNNLCKKIPRQGNYPPDSSTNFRII
ncbi:MAG: CPBP family intramembrane metalloprotease [Odoribacteraceae bacterium]|jgi:membrane protease YdiL (CAAX protease family)|nr:CPBP family intramembrane metalloprotease [Odoribacteraceae bacterium]